MFTGDLIQTIDQRIFALAPDISRSWGTVSYYSGDSADRQAMVTFDGASAAVPCRVPGNITLSSGDRVTCERYGTIWVVTHNFVPWPEPPADPRQLPNVVSGNSLTGSGFTTSGTLVAMPGPSFVTIDKAYDDSMLLASVHCTLYSTVANTFASLGVKADGPSASGVTANVGALYFNTGNTGVHQQVSGWVILPGSESWVAGSYDITAAWGRAAGTGQLTVDSNDWISIMAMEINP